jgi:flagellar biosynthesis protein FlhF
MLTKTFRAPNMLEALQEIQKELGSDAIVLSMREIPAGPLWQVWNKPGVEVVATRYISGNKQLERAVEEQSEQKQEIPATPGRKEIEAILNAIAEKNQNVSFDKSLVSSTKVKKSGINEETEKPLSWEPSLLHKSIELQPQSGSEKPAIQALENVVREFKEGQRSHLVTQKEEVLEIPPALRAIKKRMLAQGIDMPLVEHIISTNLNAISPSILTDENRLKKFMMKQLEASLRPQQNSMAVIQSRVMCLVGSSGSGKTSTIAKLAAYYSKTLGKKVIWVCADTIRAGAISETKTYTDVLEIPLFFTYSPQELVEVLESQNEADLILVDTSGISMVEEDKIVELGSYLSVLPGRSIYLTAPATMKESDIYQAISTFSPFKIRGLVVTKMDETFTYGSIFNVTNRSKLPVLYFTNGHQVLGNLHQGNPIGLISYLFGEGLLQ